MISFSFAANEEFDLLNGLIGRLLHFRLLALFLVFADRVLLQELLENIESVPAHVPDRYARVLAVFVGDLDHFLAPLLVELRNADAQNRALNRWTEAEIGVPDRLVDDLHHAFVPHRDGERAGLGNADRRHLVDRHPLAVGLHVHGLEQARAGAAGA